MNWLWALVVLVVLSLLPTVTFLLFWRFLLYLRDDALIEELQLTHGFDLTPANINPLPFGGGGEQTDSLEVCSSCGAHTPGDHNRCVLCGKRM